MRATFKFAVAAATAAAFAATVALPASAACKRYGFTVNDYGKDGPTKDAKSLLDKLIASKMSEQGIKDFHTGRKNVSCELFLNFVVFDEHTCTAEATVCWGGSALPKSEEAAAADTAEPATKKASSEASDSKAKKKDVAKKSEGVAEKKKTANHIADPKKPAQPAAPVATVEPEAAAPAASESASVPADEAPAAPVTASETHAAHPVETGSLNEPAKKSTKHRAEPAAVAPGNAAPAAPSHDGGYPTPVSPEDAPSDAAQ